MIFEMFIIVVSGSRLHPGVRRDPEEHLQEPEQLVRRDEELPAEHSVHTRCQQNRRFVISDFTLKLNLN